MIIFVSREMQATLSRMRHFPLLLALLFPTHTWWTVQECGADSNLRGVSVVPNPGGGEILTIWASGSKGLVVRSTDSGKTWNKLQIQGGEALDFRGVQALNPDTALVMSSGEGSQSRIYKTTDGGENWKLQYQGGTKDFFLDALICDDDKRCAALSDPVNGKFVVLANADGEHWEELSLENMPAALPKEGAFAASNSSLCLRGKDIYFGTGGPAARVFASHDFGQTWSVAETPIVSGNASSGIFSLSCEGNELAAVGGDYQAPNSAVRNAARSHDGGKTWQAATKPPRGYRSAVGKYHFGYVAVGPTGSEISTDGLNWKPIGSENLNAYSFTAASNKGWAAGPHGLVAQFTDRSKYLIYR
jgi:photosystem II stability/assembly factor-like uncharacterized protein